MNDTLKLLTLNIQNPSIERAEKIVDWIRNRREDVFILTETKNSKGCQYISKYFKSLIRDLFNEEVKYYTHFPKPVENNYGVMLISKYRLVLDWSPFLENNSFYGRFLNLQVIFENKPLHLLGLYVPSRDQSEIKIERKKSFLTQVKAAIKNKRFKNDVICGDLNIVSKTHIPYYNFFQNWEYDFYDGLLNNDYLDVYDYFNKNIKEYSWVGRTNNGYRYDYFFVRKEFLKYCKNCYFDHTTRLTGLTDHSAIILELKKQNIGDDIK